jgi:hypothetical protein
MSTQAHLEKLKNLIEVVEHCGGNFLEEGLVQDALGDKTIADLRAGEIEKARDLYLATAFVFSVDRGRYGKLIEDLANNFVQGTNKYPKTLEDAYNILMYWKYDSRGNGRNVGIETEGVAFAQDGERRPRDMSEIECFICHKKGHIATNCPNKRKKGSENVNLQTTKMRKIMRMEKNMSIYR